MERTHESLRHHFEVERELAARLRGSERKDRPQLVPFLYSELYRRVPDHPRTDRAKDIDASGRAIRNQFRLLQPFVTPETQFVEFGAGSGGLSRHVAKSAAKAVAVEVCAQEQGASAPTGSVEWVFHDGLTIPLPDQAFDLAFSYQVLEHVHPDDVPLHLSEAARILKRGGRYVLSTPHAFSGPHDISRHFSDNLETFHLKEWTYAELKAELRKAGFSRVGAYVKGRYAGGWGLWVWQALECAIKVFPRKISTVASRRFLNNVIVAATR